MLENKKIKNILLLTTVVMIFIESFIYSFKNDCSSLDILSNILLGIIGSSIVSWVLAIISYNYKNEETKEKLIKNLLEIYSKMVIFKYTYKDSQNKNDLIVKMQNDINDYLDCIYDIEYDLVYKLEELNIKETIVLFKYTNENSKNIANGIEIKNNKIVNNARGLNNQKEFISSYNKMLKKVREYLEKYCTEKYMVKYSFIKEMDNKCIDIESNSNKKIKYT